MDPLLHAISFVSATAASALFSAIWEGAVLAAGVALCLRLLPGLSAAARSVVWTNVFLLLVLLQVLPSVGERWSAGSGFHSSSFHLGPLWSLGIGVAWAMLSIWRGGQPRCSVHGDLVSLFPTLRAKNSGAPRVGNPCKVNPSGETVSMLLSHFIKEDFILSAFNLECFSFPGGHILPPEAKMRFRPCLFHSLRSVPPKLVHAFHRLLCALSRPN